MMRRRPPGMQRFHEVRGDEDRQTDPQAWQRVGERLVVRANGLNPLFALR
jgi:hypothetical protein